MRNIIINFLSLEVRSIHPAVYWGLAAIWVLALVSAFISVRSLPSTGLVKLVWFVLILAVPILGLGIYAFYCLFSANWQMLNPLFQNRRLGRQGSPTEPVAKA
jgi:hypothetical protein